jgi:serine/threonine protein phosphatase PrpC
MAPVNGGGTTFQGRRPGRMLPDHPLASTVRVEFGAGSIRGSSHDVNEDHYLIVQMMRQQDTIETSLPMSHARRYDEYGYAMVVADGAGETGTGEVASRTAVETLAALAVHFGKWNLRVDDRIAQEIMDRAQRFYRDVDGSVTHLASGSARPQTTLTAVFSAGNDMFFAHVGHSRAYLLREGELLRLTRDHTLQQRVARAVPGVPLTEVGTYARDLRHVLTNTIGMRGLIGPTIDLERFKLLDGDVVLVCTNGLTDAVDDVGIADLLSSAQMPAAQADALTKLAVAQGGEDDVTALVAHYHVPS